MPVMGELVPVAIRPVGPAKRMATDTERSAIPVTFQGLLGPNARLTLLDGRLI